MVRLQNVSGLALLPYLDALGHLRISVFRDYPYLYEGSLNYERDYLRIYVDSPRSLIVLAFDEADRVIGATTCLPMADEGPEFQKPFVQAGYDVERVCYFGESMLLPEYRGQGLGKEFFTRREEHARSLGAGWTTFCAVDRPSAHPLLPPGYRPLDSFWTSLGYTRQPDLQATFVWKEIHEETESAKTLTFWTKAWPQS